jgi:hypothetical protein
MEEQEDLTCRFFNMDMKKIFSIFNQNPKMISRKENWGFANMC